MVKNYETKLSLLLNFIFSAGWLLFWAATLPPTVLMLFVPQKWWIYFFRQVGYVAYIPIYFIEALVVYTLFFLYAYQRFFYQKAPLKERWWLLVISIILGAYALFGIPNFFVFFDQSL